METQKESVDDILKWSTSRLKKWLADPPNHGEASWFLLGRGAAIAASTDPHLGRERREVLFQLAVTGLRKAVDADPSLAGEARLSELALRVNLIQRELTDAFSLAKSVLEAAAPHMKLVESKKVELQSVPRETLLALRRVKNVLNVLSPIIKIDSAPEHLQWWRARYHNIP